MEDYDYESDSYVWPGSSNIQSSKPSCLRSNTGQGRSRGGWRGRSDDTNLRTRGGGSCDNRRNFNQESGNKKHITVPSDKVGRIIGKGGCKIRDLEYESEAKIKIGDSSDETTITLFGSPEAILTVEGMINKLLEDRKPAPREHFNNSHASGEKKSKLKKKSENLWDGCNRI